MQVKRWFVLALGAMFCFTPGEAQNPSLVLAEGGIEFPDGSVLESGAGSYANVLVVARSGGHYTSVQAALDAIGDTLPSASESNPYLVWIAPGVYTEKVTMKEWVDIQGSGERVTTITSSGGTSIPTDAVTLLLADNAELRFLTIENTGGAYFGVSLYLSAGLLGSKITNVTAAASGATDNNVGVWCMGSASGDEEDRATMTNVTATASGAATYNDGVINFYCSPTMTNVIASASGGTYNSGVSNHYSSSPTMTGVTATASGGSIARAVYNRESSSPTMTSVIATSSAATYNRGVENSDSSPRMANVIALASGGDYCLGVYSHDSSAPEIRNSRIEASDACTTSYFALYTDETSAPSVAYSQVLGPVGGTATNCTCLGAFDGAFEALNSICGPLP